MNKCYFDHAATNPLHPEVLESMMPYFREEFGNALSVYDLGMHAREAVEQARAEVAALVNAKPGTIVFTSSGVEANNFALRGAALARRQKGNHIIVSKVEHHSVLNSARFLEKQGFVVTYLPVDNHGLADPDLLRKSINDETVLISITHASREIGTLEPIKELSAAAKERGVAFHTDAIASTGNVPVDVQDLGVDMLSMTGHQMYGPKGIGALYIREGTRIAPLIYGGIQEGGRRAGTENVAYIVGMGRAARLAREEMSGRMEHVRKLRDRLVQGIVGIPNVYLTGHSENRLPNHASFVAEFIEGEALLLMLAMKGIYTASGSACSSKALKSSPVLLSLGIPTALAQGSIVFTLGRGNTEEEVDYALAEFPQIVSKLRAMSPFANKGWDRGTKNDTCYVGG
ncbi:MAG TPA: cysteine desulfurase family protein [Dissulfurispiraceae bacterium]|nr:cysteine desulfurase family protein [Dissulfurispiraceae bacterium]